MNEMVKVDMETGFSRWTDTIGVKSNWAKYIRCDRIEGAGESKWGNYNAWHAIWCDEIKNYQKCSRKDLDDARKDSLMLSLSGVEVDETEDDRHKRALMYYLYDGDTDGNHRRFVEGEGGRDIDFVNISDVGGILREYSANVEGVSVEGDVL